MKPAALFLVPLLLTACSSGGNIAENTAAPPLNVMSETPGDWSDLGGMVGRTPAASGLFEASAITVDLNALLGAEAEPFRRKAETGSALVREGPVLVTIGGDRDSYLAIMPSDHALAAGLKKDGRWKRWTTPGAEVPLPASIRALVQPSG
jgi:hypothetical protein